MKRKYSWTPVIVVLITLAYIKYKDLKAGYDAYEARIDEQDRVFRESVTRSLEKLKAMDEKSSQK
jgi:hypothetical protein